MFDANLCGVDAGRTVLVKFHGKPRVGDVCPLETGVYEALILDSGRDSYENARIRVRVEENLTIELKDIDVGSRMVSYHGECGDV